MKQTHTHQIQGRRRVWTVTHYHAYDDPDHRHPEYDPPDDRSGWMNDIYDWPRI